MSVISTLCVTQRKFRQIDSLVFSLVKALLSRNFCQRSHTVTVVWKKTGIYWRHSKISVKLLATNAYV